jgi:dsDNA-specific endonuclease/ATPase MutS2
VPRGIETGEPGNEPEDGEEEPLPVADETVVELPIDGTLDLHTFDPRDVASLVPDYLAACRERGICEVRIVHGKGRGVLRRIVHSVLDRDPFVAGYSLGGEGEGGWGATIVRLRG